MAVIRMKVVTEWYSSSQVSHYSESCQVNRQTWEKHRRNRSRMSCFAELRAVEEIEKRRPYSTIAAFGILSAVYSTFQLAHVIGHFHGL